MPASPAAAAAATSQRPQLRAKSQLTSSVATISSHARPFRTSLVQVLVSSVTRVSGDVGRSCQSKKENGWARHAAGTVCGREFQMELRNDLVSLKSAEATFFAAKELPVAHSPHRRTGKNHTARSWRSPQPRLCRTTPRFPAVRGATHVHCERFHMLHSKRAGSCRAVGGRGGRLVFGAH